MASRIKGIPVAPLTGVLDSRSSPDIMDSQALRMRQNYQTTGEKKLVRGCGWSKLLSTGNYNNQDYHDQLLTFTTGGIRQPVTFLRECESTRGTRALFLGTQTRIARLSEYSGNWKIIGSGYGGDASVSASAPRWRAAQVLDVLAVSNDFEKPMYHQLETPSINSGPLLQTFPDLDLIGLTRARVMWQWRNCLFLADVEMEGARFSYRIIWSDELDPTSFDPAKVATNGSITGRKDLYTNERVLGFLENPGANSGAIYTTRGIWEIAAVGGQIVFDFARRYNDSEKPGVGILKYPNTLVSLPDGHLYCAEDGIYLYTSYNIEPERLEWVHKSANLLYDDLDTTNCEVHVAGVIGHEVYLSMASNEATNACPDRTLRINTKYRTVDFVDAGFTAFCSYRSYSVQSIRDFIIQNGICTLSQLVTDGYGWVDEGLPRPLPAGTPAFTPDHIYTDVPKSIPGYPELNPEDWAQPEPSTHSLCALLGDLRLDDLCRQCEGPTLFVGAHSTDLCLKEIGNVFYRERCVNPTAVGTTDSNGYASALGSYLLDPYSSIIIFAPLFVPHSEPAQPYVRLISLVLDVIAKTSPALKVSLRVGISAQLADPNDPDVTTDINSRITWFDHPDREMKLLTALTPAQRAAQNIQPSDLIRWNPHREGRVLYLKLTVTGTGGESEWSGANAAVEELAARNY